MDWPLVLRRPALESDRTNLFLAVPSESYPDGTFIRIDPEGRQPAVHATITGGGDGHLRSACCSVPMAADPGRIRGAAGGYNSRSTPDRTARPIILSSVR